MSLVRTEGILIDPGSVAPAAKIQVWHAVSFIDDLRLSKLRLRDWRTQGPYDEFMIVKWSIAGRETLHSAGQTENGESSQCRRYHRGNLSRQPILV